MRPEWKLCAAAYGLVIGTALLVSGCSGFATAGNRNKQLGLTALMAVDTAQTVTIARNSDCLMEANPVAVALYGSDAPSQERVLITNALYISANWALGSWLDRKANQPIDLSIAAEADMARRGRWRILQAVYQFFAAVGHGAAVIGNAETGIKPFSNYSCRGQ